MCILITNRLGFATACLVGVLLPKLHLIFHINFRGYTVQFFFLIQENKYSSVG